MSRIRTLRSLIVVLTVFALVAAACGDDESDGGGDGEVTSTELVVNSQGFAQDALEEYVVPRMQEEYGVTVTMSSSLSSEALATAIAQGSNPEIDVFMLDEGPWLQGKDQDIWGELNESAMPHLDEIPDRFIDNDLRGVGYGHLVLGVLYDASAVDDPPTALYDLWDDRFCGEVTIQSFSSTFAFALLAKVNEIEGGDEQSLDGGFQKIEELVPCVAAFHGSGSQLVDLFQQGEVQVAWGGSYVAHRLGEDSPVTWAAPDEGAVLSTGYIAVADGAPHADAAMKFIDFVLTPGFQGLLAESSGAGYVHPEAELSAEFAAETPLTNAVLDAAAAVPWSVFNEQRVDLNERWQREIESGG